MENEELIIVIILIVVLGGLIYWGFKPKSKIQIIEEEKSKSQLKEKLKSIQNIVVTTGDLKEPYEIISPTFTLGQDRGGTFNQLLGGNGSPSSAFDVSVFQLKNKAYELGADAIICAKFEYRVAVGQKGLTGNYNRVVEFFSYGTAVKFKLKT